MTTDDLLATKDRAKSNAPSETDLMNIVRTVSSWDGREITVLEVASVVAMAKAFLNGLDGNKDIRPWIHVGEAVTPIVEGAMDCREPCGCPTPGACSNAERITELEAALRPFAAIPPIVLNDSATNPLEAVYYWAVLGAPGKSHFTREDLALARKALRNDR